MVYILSNERSSYDLVTYDHENSLDHRLFFDAFPLGDVNGSLNYVLNRKADIQRIKQFHVIRSTGPDLVSNKLRAIIEQVAPFEAEFFDVRVRYKDQYIDGFSCINPLEKASCVNMERSEYQRTNFDPFRPDYTFYYTVLLPELPLRAQILRCAEQPTLIVVGEKIKAACVAAKLKRLTFCRAVDITPHNRSLCDRV